MVDGMSPKRCSTFVFIPLDRRSCDSDRDKLNLVLRSINPAVFCSAAHIQNALPACRGRRYCALYGLDPFNVPVCHDYIQLHAWLD
jgi:hypothetical protein